MPAGVRRSPSRFAELTPFRPTWPAYGPRQTTYREPERSQARMVAAEPRASTRTTCREVTPEGTLEPGRACLKGACLKGACLKGACLKGALQAGALQAGALQ